MVTPAGLECWPEHMYSKDDFGERFILCPAYCGMVFRNGNDMSTLMQHIHTEIQNANAPSVIKTFHSLLSLMHSLRQCLVCAGTFHGPDNRELFEHNNECHGDDGDISTFQGFVRQVRRFAPFATLIGPSRDMEQFRHQCFREAYTYMWERVSGDPHLHRQFSTFLGYRNSGMTEAQFKAVAVASQGEFYPLHPDVFLTFPLYEKDGRHKDVVTKEEWEEIRDMLQELYRTGEI